ncbi:hypothetical protein MKW98_020356, partial [Papaver atlanticum]
MQESTRSPSSIKKHKEKHKEKGRDTEGDKLRRLERDGNKEGDKERNGEIGGDREAPRDIRERMSRKIDIVGNSRSQHKQNINTSCSPTRDSRSRAHDEMS